MHANRKKETWSHYKSWRCASWAKLNASDPAIVFEQSGALALWCCWQDESRYMHSFHTKYYILKLSVLGSHYKWASVEVISGWVLHECVYEVVLWLCPSLGWCDSPSGLSVRLLCWRPVLADKSSGTGMASSWSSPSSLAVGLSLPEQRVEKLPI